MTYYYSEQMDGNIPTLRRDWAELKSADLDAAKSEAKEDSMFSGSALFIAEKDDEDEFRTISQLVQNPGSGSYMNGEWYDC